MIFVRQNTSNTLALGPLRHTTNDTGIIDYAAITWVNVNCAAIKGTTGTAGITLTGGGNISEIDTTSVSGWAKFTPGTSYFDTLGPLVFKFVSTEFKALAIECMVLSQTTYDLLFAASGSGVQEVLESMMSKDATVPTGYGNYTPSTDSLEAIRDEFDEALAPNVVGASSMSGSGFLSDTVTLIRQIVEESSINTKYTDADVIEYLKGSIGTVMTDINANTDHPVVVRWSFPIVVDKQTYTLPPHCQKVYWIAKINSQTGYKEWEILPGSRWDFGSYGFRLEGNTLRLLTKWKTGYTVELGFVPNSETFIHKGDTATYTTTTVTLPSSVTDGSRDTRPDSYAGYLFRVLSSTDSAAVYTQDRLVTGYNNQTRVVTVAEAFSPALVGTITYELIPAYSGLLKHVWAFHAAMTILGIEGAAKKYSLVKDIYDKRLRAFKGTLRKEFRIGQVWENQTTTNARSNYPYFGTGGL